jgi:hypothetical protein
MYVSHFVDGNHADMFHVLNVHTCDNLYVCIMHYCIILDMLCIIVICIYNIKDKIVFVYLKKNYPNQLN